MPSPTHSTRNNHFPSLTDATIYVGGLDDKVTESLLWELFVQAGPVGKSINTRSSSRVSNLNTPHPFQ